MVKVIYKIGLHSKIPWAQKNIYGMPSNLDLFIWFQFIALLISFPYIGIQIDQYSVQNIQGLLYLVIVETVFTYSYSVYNTFPQEMPILLREINNDLYKPAPYYASKMICLVSILLITDVMKYI